MNKYHNGKIYKIVDVGYSKQYIGSTTESLSMRMARRRSDYKRKNEGKKVPIVSSLLLFDEFGVENCKIELIEYCKVDTKDELVRCEGDYIKNSDCVNKQVAGRTKEEYRIENRQYLSMKSKEYGQIEYTCDVCNKTLRVADKSKHLQTAMHSIKLKELEDPEYNYKEELEAKRKAYRKTYYEDNIDIIKEKRKNYRDTHKEEKHQRDKIYRESNVEKIREMRQLYYQKNKEKVKEKVRQHYVNKKHQDYLKSLENQDD